MQMLMYILTVFNFVIQNLNVVAVNGKTVQIMSFKDLQGI